MVAHVSVAVSDPSQVGEARRKAMRMAEEAALGDTERGAVGVIVTELAANLSKYAQNGRILLQVLRRSDGPCVEVLAMDSGPGIANVEESLRDGFSTSGTPGTGLGAVRRMATEFDVYSVPGAGTVVLARVGAKCGEPVRFGYQWAAVSVPAPHETVCGDAWRVVEREGEIALLVADGLGHGPLAAEAADRAAEVFDAEAFEPPGRFVERAHRARVATRGAAMAAAHVARNAVVRYAGVGNIAGTVVTSSQSRGLFSQNGTVGLQMRAPRQLDYEWPDRALLIMHSDGVSNRWSLGAYEGLIARHPAVVAAVLLRDFGRGRDDATVVVVRSDRRFAGSVHE
jgi:anti-sigma regulatory factor (Ser/Thr protein kinase)